MPSPTAVPNRRSFLTLLGLGAAGAVAPAQAAPRQAVRTHLLTCYAAGFRHHAGTLLEVERELGPGAWLSVVPEPANRYDADALALCTGVGPPGRVRTRLSKRRPGAPGASGRAARRRGRGRSTPGRRRGTGSRSRSTRPSPSDPPGWRRASPVGHAVVETSSRSTSTGGRSRYQSTCFDHRAHDRHWVSRHVLRHAGHVPPVSNVFHEWPHAHAQRSPAVGSHSHRGQAILTTPRSGIGRRAPGRGCRTARPATRLARPSRPGTG